MKIRPLAFTRLTAYAPLITGGVPVSLLRQFPCLFAVPSEVHSRRLPLPRSHHPQLSVRFRSRRYSSPSSVCSLKFGVIITAPPPLVKKNMGGAGRSVRRLFCGPVEQQGGAENGRHARHGVQGVVKPGPRPAQQGKGEMADWPGGSRPVASTQPRKVMVRADGICGYVADKAELPDGYQCPICRASKDKFVKV